MAVQHRAALQRRPAPFSLSVFNSLLGACENPVKCHSNPSPNFPPPGSAGPHMPAHAPCRGEKSRCSAASALPSGLGPNESTQDCRSSSSPEKKPSRESNGAVAERSFLQPGSWEMPFLPAELALARPRCKTLSEISGCLGYGGSWTPHQQHQCAQSIKKSESFPGSVFLGREWGEGGERKALVQSSQVPREWQESSARDAPGVV